MKFAVFTVVVLALVFRANSSVIPVVAGDVGPLLSVSGPLGPIVVPGGSVAIQASVVQGLPASVALQVPNTVAIQAVAPAAVAVPAPIVVTAEGTYVAKTRGTVHVAPLPGHALSASSVNLQPAPGTLLQDWGSYCTPVSPLVN